MNKGELNMQRHDEVVEMAQAAHDRAQAAFLSDKQAWDELHKWMQGRYIAAALAVEAVVLKRIDACNTSLDNAPPWDVRHVEFTE